MLNVVFVAPFFMTTTLRFVKAVATEPDVRLVLVSQDPIEKLPPDVRGPIAAHVRVDDGLDPRSLVQTISEICEHLGRVHRLFGALEELQVPLAEVRERFDIPGMDVEAARNFRDKSRMKGVLRESGLPCARSRLAATAREAVDFVEEVGYPVVVKPPEGSGARGTHRLEDERAFADYLARFAPTPRVPTLFEEFVVGDEHSFDSVSIQGRAVWHSISRYYPSPLAVLENPWIQWCVVLPRDVSGPEFDGIRAAGTQALEALGMGTGLTHMEWFRRRDGSVAISEVAARPPGAQFTTLMSYAHDLDMYRAWARLMVHDRFEPPAREFAVACVFLRGQGRGRVTGIHGLDVAGRDVGDVVVEAKLPRPGQARSDHYEGDGYVILRHAETAVVEAAARRVLEVIQVEVG